MEWDRVFSFHFSTTSLTTQSTPSVVGTAVVYARRFLFDRGLDAVAPPALAAGALFLAAKAEESHVSLAGVVAAAAKAAGERES